MGFSQSLYSAFCIDDTVFENYIPKCLTNYVLQVRVVDGLVDCDFEDTCVMELLTDFMAELVADGELILARALRSKFIQKFEQRKARLLPELDTSGLSLLSKFDNPQLISYSLQC